MEEKESNVCPFYMKNFIFHCAREGLSLVVSSQLKDMKKNESKQQLEQVTVDEMKQRMTPLMAAALNGHDSTVRILLKEFDADPNVLGSVKFDGFIVENASPLWCAAAHGHLKVVKALVEAGACINHITQSYSTPLRAACYDGRLDIIKYLVAHGATLNIPNKFNNSCLMISAFRGHYHVVNYLLDEGMDPNEMANCGATPLFYAAQANQLHVLKLLLSREAIPKPTKAGLTPCLAAAELCNEQVVDFFCYDYNGLTISEKIDALELLGASFANDRDNHCINKAYHYLHKAMSLRYQDSDNIITKPNVTPIRAYKFWVESQTLDELAKIRSNADALHMEGLVIRERILGHSNPELLTHILFRGAVFADDGKYQRCLDLWFHALKLSIKNGLRVSKDLVRFIQIFCQMERLGLEIQFSMLKKILSIAINEVSLAKKRYDDPHCDEEHPVKDDDLQFTLLVALYLLVLTVNILPNNDSLEREDVYEMGYKLNKIKARNKEGKTLLHLSVDPFTPDCFRANHSGISFPCPKTTKLLLECGADVNALDKNRNTPLHTIATYKRSIRDFKTLHSIITHLTDAGAHMDIVNLKGETPMDSANSALAEVIFQTQTKPPPLKCLAARIVANNRINYVGQVPVGLIPFIQLHGTAMEELPDNIY
ncbi:protein fem-1 homolog B isoform X2 [Cimex lectularius]|uniref:Uncharacterized protein n=1 Tax=Cimex lectularius TaxID=79782 RepID=A0A8I6TEM4_CIMLE|nr:protein fem-1 homolog B isoform X2 [Cimex lectularius]